MSWNLALLQAMKDPTLIVIKADRLVAIKDKFPKAKNHFLIIPHENIDTVFNLTKNDIDLVNEILNEMTLLGLNIIQSIGQKEENFKMGFHAEPSMKRLHLHVISQDYISPTLKNKKHWNSFNTPFLWHPSKIISDLEVFGNVQRLSKSEATKLLDTPLKCNSCQQVSRNIPDLKNHLLTHESLYA